MRIELTGGEWYRFAVSNAITMEIVEAIEFLTVNVTANSQGGKQTFERLLGGDRIVAKDWGGRPVTFRGVEIYSDVDQVIYVNVLSPAWAGRESNRIVGTVQTSDGTAARSRQTKSFLRSARFTSGAAEYPYMGFSNVSGASDDLIIQGIRAYFGAGGLISCGALPAASFPTGYIVHLGKPKDASSSGMDSSGLLAGGDSASIPFGADLQYTVPANEWVDLVPKGDPIVIPPGYGYAWALNQLNTAVECVVDYTRAVL